MSRAVYRITSGLGRHFTEIVQTEMPYNSKT